MSWHTKRCICGCGAGDNAAAACGVGIMQEGQGFVSLGTSGVLLTARSECNPIAESAVHTFCHALPIHGIKWALFYPRQIV